MSEDNPRCDRCNSLIVMDEFERPRPFNIVIETTVDDETDKLTYEAEDRILCSGCEEDLLEWIDEGDIDRSDCVDLPETLESAEALEYTANTLQQTARVLRRELDTEETDTDA